MDLWRRAYLRYDKDGRKRVDLVNTGKDRTTISYAKYVYTVHTGDFVPEGMTVDHINEDKTDDRPDNLQLLTLSDNSKKWVKHYRDTVMVTHPLVCPQCGTSFTLSTSEYSARRGNKNIFCSRSCNGKYYPKPYGQKSEEEIREILDLHGQGLSAYRISKITGITANTVLKYIKMYS